MLYYVVCNKRYIFDFHAHFPSIVLTQLHMHCLPSTEKLGRADSHPAGPRQNHSFFPSFFFSDMPRGCTVRGIVVLLPLLLSFCFSLPVTRAAATQNGLAKSWMQSARLGQPCLQHPYPPCLCEIEDFLATFRQILYFCVRQPCIAMMYSHMP
jgi:hypothetical protein